MTQAEATVYRDDFISTDNAYLARAFVAATAWGLFVVWAALMSFVIDNIID